MGSEKQTADPVPSTVADLVRRSAGRVPDRLALRFGERDWSYLEFDRAVTQVASRLLALGVPAGARVAAFGRNSDAYVLLFLGCARAGLVHVPINYNVSDSELRSLVERADASVLFVDADLAARGLPAVPHLGTIHGGDGRTDVLCWAQQEGGTDRAPTADIGDNAIVQLLFTAGTTSEPKAAMMTHRALIHTYLSTIVAMDYDERDRVLHSLPLYHAAQMHALLMPALAVGAINHLVDQPVPTAVLRHIESERITTFFAPPTVWIGLSEHADFRTRDLSSLRKAYYGASIMPVPVLDRLQHALPEAGFYNCFGQSEAGPLTTVLRPEEHAERPDSAGRAVLFVELRVVDEELRDVPAGEPGELLYRSPQLCAGYWGDPGATELAFVEGWFRSGDLVVRDDAGYIRVIDRIKDAINTGGVLVSSREVEDALHTHPAVVEVAVVGVPHARWIEAIAAVVVTREPVDEQILIAYARERLNGVKAPKLIWFVDELPKSAAGKVLKRQLRERFGDTIQQTQLINCNQRERERP